MKSLRRARVLVPAVLAPLFVAASVAQQEGPRFELQHVAGEVHVLYGAGGNIAFQVGGDGVLMIDDQFANVAEQIDAKLDELTSSPVRYLVNTHWHGDHTGGNPHFGQGATIVSHINVRRRLLGGEGLDGRGNEPPMEAPGLPTITHENGLSLHVNGEEVRLLHPGPGHTDGDSVVWFTGSNVVHMGDLLFADMFPFVDSGSGGDPRAYVAAQAHVLELVPDDVIVIPGHGQVTDKAGIQRAHDLLADCIRLVEEALARGESLEDMKQSNPLAVHEDKAWAFMTMERFLESLVDGLTD